MKHLFTVYKAVNLLLAVIAGALILVVTLLIGAEALSRSIGLGVIRGVVEISENAMFCIALLSAPWILSLNGHIRISLLTAKLGDNANSRLSALTEGLCLSLSLWIAYEGWGIFWQGYQANELIFGDLIFPDWWLLWQTPIAFSLMSIEFTRRCVMALQGKNLHSEESQEADYA